MKLIPCIAVASAVAFSGQAFAKDIDKGQLAIAGGTNGSLSFLTTEVDALDTEFETTTLNLEAAALYFVEQNIALGLSYTYDSTTTEYENNYETESTMVVIEPGIFYNYSLSEDNSLLFSASFAFGSVEESETDEETYELDLSGFTFRGDFQHFVTDNIALTAGAEYRIAKIEEDTSGYESETSGLTFGVGAILYFGK